MNMNSGSDESVAYESAEDVNESSSEVATAVTPEPGVPEPAALEPLTPEPVAVETGDVRVDAAVARLVEATGIEDSATIAVLTDVHDTLHHVLLNP